MSTGKLLVIAALSLSCVAQADIYKYQQPNGAIVITNQKPRQDIQYKTLVHSRPRPATYQQDLKHAATHKHQFNLLIEEAAYRHNLDAKLLHAVIQAESAYNPNAISSAGAVGLMQLMPDTAQRYGVTDRYDAGQNIDGGARYLKDLLHMFNYNLHLAIAGYNAGEGAVMKYNYTIPPYPETRNYVQQVMQLYYSG
jgi:soluble lytic murein transglycosylase-like protein